MLPKGLTYPETWPAMYTAKDKKQYACCIAKTHLDDIDPYYTVYVLEGPFAGERQTVAERLSSWVDELRREEIKQVFLDYQKEVSPAYQNNANGPSPL